MGQSIQTAWQEEQVTGPDRAVGLRPEVGGEGQRQGRVPATEGQRQGPDAQHEARPALG